MTMTFCEQQQRKKKISLDDKTPTIMMTFRPSLYLFLTVLTITSCLTLFTNSRRPATMNNEVAVLSDAAADDNNFTGNITTLFDPIITDVYELNFSQPSQINFTRLVQDLGLAKAFNSRHFTPNEASSKPAWCTHNRPQTEQGKGDHSFPFETGLLFNKNPKAASSTTAGVVLRIAHHVASRFSTNTTVGNFSTRPCDSHQSHVQELGKARFLFAERDRKRSFLFSSIRDPATQAISHIFFHHITLGRNAKKPTDQNMIKFLQEQNHQSGVVSPRIGGYQVAYLTLDIGRYKKNIGDIAPAWKDVAPTNVSNPDIVHERVKSILADYDFMLLVERYDESLVALQLGLGLRPTDILYMSSKTSGSSYTYSKGRCVKIKKPFVSPLVAKYLSSDEWYAKQYGDYLLHEAVNQSLDLTIKVIGKKKFQQALVKFQALKRQGEEKCADSTFPPCSNEGKPQKELSKQSCYALDWGCGAPCLDTLK